MVDDNPVTMAIRHTSDLISERVKHWACPACDGEKWHVPTEGAVMVMWCVPEGLGVRPTMAVDAASCFVCDKCGYVRLHMPPDDLRLDAALKTIEDSVVGQSETDL
jgi:hypothetical protein